MLYLILSEGGTNVNRVMNNYSISFFCMIALATKKDRI